MHLDLVSPQRALAVRLRRRLTWLLPIAMMAGCASPSAELIQLRQRQTELLSELDEKNARIVRLNENVAFLEGEVAYFQERGDVLDREKAERLDEIKTLRKGVRTFTDAVIQTLQDSYQKTETVDYIGAELFARSKTGNEENQLLVDLENRIEANGTIIGGRAYVAQPATLQFLILRPTGEPNKYRAMFVSEELAAAEPGPQSWTFTIPFAASEGDVIAVSAKGTVPIPYDEVSTGSVALVPSRPQPQSVVTVPEPTGRTQRAYSFGVIGYLGE